MSRIPNTITGSDVGSGGRLPSPSLSSVTALSTTAGQGLGKGLEKFGKAAIGIAIALGKGEQIDRDNDAIANSRDELQKAELDNESDPLEVASRFKESSDDLIANGGLSTPAQLRMRGFQNDSIRIAAGKTRERALVTIDESIDGYDPTGSETVEQFSERVIEDSPALSPLDKRAMVERLLKVVGKKEIAIAEVTISKSVDSKQMQSAIDDAIKANPQLPPETVRERTLGPAIMAAARRGDIDRVMQLSKLLQGTAIDLQATAEALAIANNDAATSAQAAVSMFSGLSPMDPSKVSSEPLSRNKSFRAIRELDGATLEKSAEFFMRLDGNLPKALINELKDEAAEGGLDNINSVVNTLRVIGRFDQSKASSVAKSVGGISNTAYWASTAFVDGDPAIELINSTLSSATGPKLHDEASVLFTGRRQSKTKGVGGLAGKNITTRLNDADLGLKTLDLSAMQARRAEALFLYRAVEHATVNGLSNADEINDKTKVIAKRAFEDLSDRLIELPRPIRFGFDHQVLADSDKFGVGTVGNHQDIYPTFVEQLDAFQRNTVGASGKTVPQNAVTELGKTFIPAVDSQGAIRSVMVWDQNTGESKTLKATTDEREFNQARDLILSNTDLNEFDALVQFKYDPDRHGDISYSDANRASNGRLSRVVNALSRQEFRARFDRNPDPASKSDEDALVDFGIRITLDKLLYPRISDFDDEQEVGGIQTPTRD